MNLLYGIGLIFSVAVFFVFTKLSSETKTLRVYVFVLGAIAALLVSAVFLLQMLIPDFFQGI